MAGDDTVKVESLVQEFLSAQSLRALPQGPFGDAVNQFVAKDDKHAMELFVSEHLTGQVRQMLGLESDDEDLNSAMEIYRNRVEHEQASGQAPAQQERKRMLKPKPSTWDSDFDGSWENEPDAWTYDAEEAEEAEEEAPAPKRGRAKAAPKAKAAVKKAPAKKAPARRGRKAVEPESEEEDVVMESDEPAPPPKTRKAPARAAPKTAAKPRATRGAKTKQSKLDFSQASNAVEISDDEISDDDAFEPAPTTRARRR
jgi:double-strand break repair protein MRE11